MAFDRPVPFAQALEYHTVKAILPTSLDSAQLSEIQASLRTRALVSSRVANATLLQEYHDVIGELLDPATGAGIPQGRLRIKKLLDKMEYHPEKPGTIEDLGSDQRINLVIDTNLQMAQGYGNFVEANDPDILFMWPAQEFMRLESREEPRDWPARWIKAGGSFFKGRGSYPQGRMIALKTDDIWVALSIFDLPYPPFDFNSGMGLRDISRKESIRLGLLDVGDEVEPQPLEPFNEGMEMSVAGLADEFLSSLLESLGEGYQIVKGVLSLAK